MSTSTFHKFSELPYELRRQVWDSAIRPSEYGGLHHFVIKGPDELDKSTSKNFTVLWNQGSPPKAGSYSVAVEKLGKQGDSPALDNPVHRSAYLWDAGLWTACYESREAMMDHFKLRQWRQGREELISRFRKFDSGTFESFFRPKREYWDLPSMQTVDQEAQEWPLLVNTYRDLFCLTFPNWPLEIDLPSVFWNLYFPSNHYGHGPIRYLAIEFDPSWNLNFPNSYSQLLEEPSARGFLARVVKDCTNEELECFIWLIDRSVRVPRQRQKTEPNVFYDCGTAYIEADCRRIDWDDDGLSQSAGAFFCSFAILGDEWFDKPPFQVFPPDGSEDAYLWDPNEFVGILTCGEFNVSTPDEGEPGTTIKGSWSLV